MKFETGDKIKVFPNTDVNTYANMIREEGFRCEREGEYLIVGERYEDLEMAVLPSTIKYARRIKGISQAQLAEMCEVTKQTVSNWEYGYTVPRELDKVKEILEFE